MTALANAAPAIRPLRLGFLGLGWIGRHRMEAIVETGLAGSCVVADPSADAIRATEKAVSGLVVVDDLDQLLDSGLDGIVIATPSAFHATQSIRALERGVAVLCQKPLGRNAAEVARVVEAAEASGSLLGVDMSYRHTRGMAQIRDLVRGGDLGDVYAVDLVFHNAYGPDKPWFHDPRLSGGGCLMDLGVHLVDLALWVLDYPRFERVAATLYRQGRAVEADEVEDFAAAQIEMADGRLVRIACSWNLPAGQDAVIGASFFGTRGGAEFSNVNGSFYDFVTRHLHGTASETIDVPPDAWGGRAAVRWAQQLAAGSGFDPEVKRMVDVSDILDTIYDYSRRSL